MKPEKDILYSIGWKEGSYFVAQCLTVNISSFGDTKEEALRNLDEAISLYFEDEPMRSML